MIMPRKTKKTTHTKPSVSSTAAKTKKSTAKNTAIATPATMMPYKFKPYETKAREPYMNDRQLAHFRAILEDWKQELMKEVDNTLLEMKEASVTVLADPNDRATQEETFNLELRTRDRERKLIRKIEEALQQIENKEYGHCESCGVEIGIRRLEARPTAVLCIDCKTLDEIREKRTTS
jgi:DnaK suppressor protein